MMKKSIISIVLLTMALIIIGCNNDTTDNNDDDTAVLVCLGDSLTAGFGASTPGVDDKTKSYPAYLQNKVKLSVINAGVSGDTTTAALARLNTDVLKKKPQVIIIELGANDLFNSIPIATTTANLQNIIDALNDGYRKIYLAKFYTETVARAMAANLGITDDATQTILITQYNNMFNTLATSNNIDLIEDIWDGIWGVHMSDTIHPNATGYEIMANNYFNAIKIYLQENSWIK